MLPFHMSCPYLYAPGGELYSDCGFGFQIEFVSGKP